MFQELTDIISRWTKMLENGSVINDEEEMKGLFSEMKQEYRITSIISALTG